MEKYKNKCSILDYMILNCAFGLRRHRLAPSLNSIWQQTHCQKAYLVLNWINPQNIKLAFQRCVYVQQHTNIFQRPLNVRHYSYAILTH